MRSILPSCLLLSLACATPVAITSLVVGDDQSCVIAGNQTLCWGDGEGVPTRSSYGSEVMELLMGSDTYCVHLADTGWSCWGSNSMGQFGVSSPTTTTTPVPVPFTGETLELARFGGEFTCGLTMGELACWGAGERGQLGPSVSTNTFSPTIINLPDQVHDFALGRDHACALTATMGVWCWGAGTEGQLGNLSSQDSPLPIRVPFDADFAADLSNLDSVSIALGEEHSCVQAGAEVRCWGADDVGQLGQPVRDTPLGVHSVPVEFAGVIHAGANHTCSHSASSQCWGDNDSGQLQSPAPMPLGPLSISVTPVDEIGLGNMHSCVLSEGQVLCWGSATLGQLGAATSVDTFVPTTVRGLP